MAQSNVGKQRVVGCWSSIRERASSELGTDARDGNSGVRPNNVIALQNISVERQTSSLLELISVMGHNFRTGNVGRWQNPVTNW